MKKLTAAIVTAIIGISAFAGVSIINLENGDTRLDMRYARSGSVELLGIECITANNTGNISLSVGKHMEAKRKVTSQTPIYATNVTVVLNHKEYNYIGRSIYTYVENPGEPNERRKSETNDFTFVQKDRPQYDTFTARHEGAYNDWTLVDTQNGFTNFTLNGSISTFSGSHNFTGSANYDNPQDSININVSDRRYSGYTFDFEYVGRRTQVIEYYNYITNIVQVGTITNVSWQTVNRTCYKDVINTSLTNGIAINYLDNPIRLFRNDYLRLSCPIESETNPGKFKVILRD